MHFRFSKWLVVCISVVVVSMHLGCGGSGSTSDEKGPTANDGLVDLQRMLKELGEGSQKLPKNQAELAAIDPIYPTAAAFIQNGQVIYFWGTPINASAPNAATTVIAHESKTETEGGFVLLQDGNIKEMTADEFKAAPKSGKKK